MNRRNFIKGVMATAAGGALALVAKESIAAAPPQATVLAGESGFVHGVEIAELLPLKNATASAIWDSTPHTFTATNGIDWALHQQTNVAPIEPQPFPPYDDWCGTYVDHALDAMQYAHPVLVGEQPSATELATYNRFLLAQHWGVAISNLDDMSGRDIQNALTVANYFVRD